MTKSLSDLAEAMRDIDFSMLTTRTENGALSARPMSNNRDVDYNGDSWFFASDDNRSVHDIERDPQVGLTYQTKGGLLGKPPIFIGVEGLGHIHRDKAEFAQHWSKDLERYFEDGIDTPGLVMIHVHADRIHYWDGEEEGDVKVPASAYA